MTEDWAVDVRKYVPDADEAAISGIVRHCGIALQKRDSALVSFSDDDEVAVVRESFLKKKLGLTDPDTTLNAAIADVGERMRADRTKNRVTVYYLLAQRFKKLHLFGGAEMEPIRERSHGPEAIAAGVGVAALAAGAAMGRTPERASDTLAFERAPPAAAAPVARSGMGWLPWVLGAAVLALLAWYFLMRRPAVVAAPPAAVAVAPAIAAPVEVTPLAPAPAPAALAQTRVHFANASSVLSAEDRAVIRSTAEGLRAGSGKVAITGYTDNTGSAGGNQALARHRASAVRAALIADGIPQDRIVMQPPATVEVGATPASDAEARRVDIVPQ